MGLICARYISPIMHLQSRDSSVGIALGYGLDDRGRRVRFPAGAGNLSLHHRIQNGSGTHTDLYPRVLGALSLRVMRPGMKLTTQLHLVPMSIMRGTIPPLPQYVFMAWCLVKRRDNFTFTFIMHLLYKKFTFSSESSTRSQNLGFGFYPEPGESS
jgi:hypothetical protein